MIRNFSNAEILQSVELLLSGNRYSKNDKKKVRDNYKRFTNKNIKMKEDAFEKDSIEVVNLMKKNQILLLMIQLLKKLFLMLKFL